MTDPVERITDERLAVLIHEDRLYNFGGYTGSQWQKDAVIALRELQARRAAETDMVHWWTDKVFRREHGVIVETLTGNPVSSRHDEAFIKVYLSARPTK